ncbi:Conserved_hypothetical protein [Hexamita inflata]|uniref:Transmembrane protein n=1 Tax=Hexamita inflata TaxID=28002 RepID=A0ABP1HE12_9EUKA
MLLFVNSFQLNCFTQNSSILLSFQTRKAKLNLQQLNDNSKDMLLCKQLEGSTYNIQITTGTFTYTYSKQLTYSSSSDIEVEFSCIDTISKCDDAFAATSATFQMFFPDTHTYVEDSISDLKIDKYNRLDCIINPYISVVHEQYLVKVYGTDTGCVIPLDQTKYALLTLKAHPDFVLTKTLSLQGLTSVQDVLNNVVFDCLNDYTKTPQRTCKRMVKEFIESVSSFAELTISFSGMIPDNTTASYSRNTLFSIKTDIVTISSSFVEKFDCYKSQEIVYFTDMFRLNLPTNESMVNCKQPIDKYIGDFDKSTYITKTTKKKNHQQQTKKTKNKHQTQTKKTQTKHTNKNQKKKKPHKKTNKKNQKKTNNTTNTTTPTQQTKNNNKHQTPTHNKPKKPKKNTQTKKKKKNTPNPKKTKKTTPTKNTPTTIQIQENTDFRIGTIVSLQFDNVIPDFQSNKPWLPCDLEVSGKQSCEDKIKIISQLPTRTAFIARMFYKNGVEVQSFQTSATSRKARQINGIANITRTQICFHTSTWVNDKQTVQVRVQLMAGMPFYSEVGHDTVLDIRGQVQYPVPEEIYCFNFILNESQDAAYTKLMNMENVTGLWSFLGTQVAIYDTNFDIDSLQVNYLGIAMGLVAFFVTIWFIITLYYELHHKTSFEVSIQLTVADISVIRQNINNNNNSNKSVVYIESRRQSGEIPEVKPNAYGHVLEGGLIDSRRQSFTKQQLAEEVNNSRVEEQTDDFGRIRTDSQK